MDPFFYLVFRASASLGNLLNDWFCPWCLPKPKKQTPIKNKQKTHSHQTDWLYTSRQCWCNKYNGTNLCFSLQSHTILCLLYLWRKKLNQLCVFQSGARTHIHTQTLAISSSPEVSSLHNKWGLLIGGRKKEGVSLKHTHTRRNLPVPLCSLGIYHLTAVVVEEIPALFSCLLFAHLLWFSASSFNCSSNTFRTKKWPQLSGTVVFVSVKSSLSVNRHSVLLSPDKK